MSEMDRLAEMMTMRGINFARIVDNESLDTGMFAGVPMRNQILVRKGSKPVFSAVCHIGSYGSTEGLIEAWCFKGEPVGHLTADQAFAYFMKEVG